MPRKKASPPPTEQVPPADSRSPATPIRPPAHPVAQRMPRTAKKLTPSTWIAVIAAVVLLIFFAVSQFNLLVNPTPSRTQWKQNIALSAGTFALVAGIITGKLTVKAWKIVTTSATSGFGMFIVTLLCYPSPPETQTVYIRLTGEIPKGQFKVGFKRPPNGKFDSAGGGDGLAEIGDYPSDDDELVVCGLDPTNYVIDKEPDAPAIWTFKFHPPDCSVTIPVKATYRRRVQPPDDKAVRLDFEKAGHTQSDALATTLTKAQQARVQLRVLNPSHAAFTVVLFDCYQCYRKKNPNSPYSSPAPTIDVRMDGVNDTTVDTFATVEGDSGWFAILIDYEKDAKSNRQFAGFHNFFKPVTQRMEVTTTYDPNDPQKEYAVKMTDETN